MLLLEKNIDCLVVDTSRLHLTFVAFCLLSVICKQQLKQCNYSVISVISACEQILRHQHEISVAESQTFLRAKCPLAAMSEEKRLFSQAIEWPPNNSLGSMAVLTAHYGAAKPQVPPHPPPTPHLISSQFLSLPSPSLGCLRARPKPPCFACFPFRNSPQCPNQPSLNQQNT